MQRQKLYQSIKSKTWLLIITLAGIIIVSCITAPINRMYSGPALPKDQVALLYRGTTVKLVSFDGILLYNTNIEFLPGLHTIEVKYYFKGTNIKRESKENFTMQFYGEPAHEYRLESVLYRIGKNIWYPEFKWCPVIKDLTTGYTIKPDSSLCVYVVETPIF